MNDLSESDVSLLLKMKSVMQGSIQNNSLEQNNDD